MEWELEVKKLNTYIHTTMQKKNKFSASFSYAKYGKQNRGFNLQ